MDDTLPQVRLKIARRSGHPWIFQKMVEKPTARIPPGSVVDIIDRDGQWVGRGFYNGHSRIALRVLTAKPEEPIDAGFLRAPADPRPGAAPRLAEARCRQRRLSPGPFRRGRSERPGRGSIRLDAGAGVFLGRHVSLSPVDPRRIAEALSRQPIVLVRGGTRAEAGIVRLPGAASRRPPTSSRNTACVSASRPAASTRPASSWISATTASSWPGSVPASACSTFAATAAASRSTPRPWAQAEEVIGIDLDEEAIALAKQNANLNQARVRFVQADLFAWLRDVLGPPQPSPTPSPSPTPGRVEGARGRSSTWWFSTRPSRRATAKRSITP